jgi:hypothetical protein
MRTFIFSLVIILFSCQPPNNYIEYQIREYSDCRCYIRITYAPQLDSIVCVNYNGDTTFIK